MSRSCRSGTVTWPHLQLLPALADPLGALRADRRDGHDDDQPGRHRQLRGDGGGVGRRRDRHQALRRAQPRAQRRGGRAPDRRHPAVLRGGARRPAPADPAGRGRGGCGADGRLLVAGGRGRVDRCRPPRARVATRVVGRGTGREFVGFNRAAARCSRRRSSPRAPPAAGGGDPRRPRAPGRVVDKTAGPRSVRPWTSSWPTCARRSATDDDRPRRGVGAPAHGDARRHRRRRAALRRARRGRRRPAAVVEATESDEVTAEGPTRTAALAVAGASARRSATSRAPGSGWSRRSRRTSASARARSSRSRSPRRCARSRDARPTRRDGAHGRRGARSAVGLWTFALGGLWSRAAAAAAPTTRRRCSSATRCRRSGAACSPSRRPSRGCRAARRRRRSPTSAPTPSGRRGSPRSC